jgi:hypothetical protein
LKHGLRAEEFALPGEDQEALKQLTDEWVDYYEPRSPGERALVDRCVYATLQAKRCARFHAEAVAEQVRIAHEDWGRKQEDELAELEQRLQTDPAEAVRLLKRSSLGCRWMRAQWGELLAVLDRGKTWVVSERDRAIRLLGVRPEPEHLRDNPLAFLVYYYIFLSWAKPSEDLLAWLTDAARMPDQLVRDLGRGNYPDRETSRKWLYELVADAVVELDACAERLRVEVEGPSVASLTARSSLLGGPEGALLARYERMHDTAFHRSYKALLKGEVQHEDEVAPSAPAAPSPSTADGGVEVLDITAAKPGAPNEATVAVATGVKADQNAAKPDAPRSFEPLGVVVEGALMVAPGVATADLPVAQGS